MLIALAVLALTQAAAAEPDGGVHAATPVEQPPKAIDPPADPMPPPGVPVIELADSRAWWQRWTPEGYVKAGVFYTFPFSNEQLVGSNGGFRMLSARLGVSFNPVEQLTVGVSIEAAAPVTNSSDPLSGYRAVELRDAYLEYRVCKGFWVRAGQFKAPYNGETLLGDADLPFVARSVVSEGVSPPEAYGPREGLTLGRQIGLMIFSDRIGTEAIGLRYFVAAVNGNGQNQLYNDSNPVAPVARVEVDVMKKVSLGLNGYYNVSTVGVRPNRINVNQLGYGADLAVHFGGSSALAGFLGRNSSYSGAATGGSVLPSDSALGFFAQLHYLLDLGVEAGLRGAYYEPSSAQADDQVYEINAMAGYRFKKVPLRVILQFTARGEAPAVTIGNNSLDAMVQVTW